MTSHVSHEKQGWVVYLAIIALIIFMAFVGYQGFRFFADSVMSSMDTFSLVTLSITAGVASFFSPCAFPLLPGYLSLYYMDTATESADNPSHKQALALGAVAGLGITTFNLLIGIGIGILGAGVIRGISLTGPEPMLARMIRGSVGAVLIALGIAQMVGTNLKPMFLERLSYRTRPSREGYSAAPWWRIYLYGFGYNAAGMGCTGPILAGLMVVTFGSGGVLSALIAFGLFSLTMGALMLIISLLIAASEDTLLQKLKVAAPRVKQVASLLLIAVGVFNVLTSVNLQPFIRTLFPG